MKGLIYQLSHVLVIATAVFAMVACQGKNDDQNKDAELTSARANYEKCSQARGQQYCSGLRAGNILSINEFYGTAMGLQNAGVTGPQYNMYYNAEQLNYFFENYARSLSKDQINSLSTVWLFNSSAPMMPGSRCTAYGCM